MLYIMESQLASLLLKPRRPISCLCMSGCGPHPRHTEPRSTRTPTRPPDDVNGASSWGMSSSRRYHREREREREGGRQAWSCSLRVLLGFHELDDDREMRREQAHSPGTDNGVRHCKSNLPSVFPPCTENTLSANHSRPLSTHGFPSVQSFPQKFRDPAIHFHVKIFRIVIRFVSPTTCYPYPRDLSF